MLPHFRQLLPSLAETNISGKFQVPWILTVCIQISDSSEAADMNLMCNYLGGGGRTQFISSVL